MSILKKFVDVASHSRAGDAQQGIALTTQSHSLPQTKAQAMWMQLRSRENLATSVAGAANGPVDLLAVDSNASLASIGYYFGSAPSVPTIYYDRIMAVYHSSIA